MTNINSGKSSQENATKSTSVDSWQRIVLNQ